MIRLRPAPIAFAALALALACSDIVSPTRDLRYDWRLLVDFDSLGPRTDTLSFHWPRNRLPVKIWVEDQFSMPARVQEGIDRWKQAFLYGEWDATIVQDSTIADVIVRTIPPPPIRLPGPAILRALPCQGATDVDTAATRFELKVPIRTYINPDIPGDPDITECLRVVAAHEIGHTMGIFQHSPDSTDLMYPVPSISGLSSRDVGTIVNAYHFRADIVPVGP